MKSVLVVVAGAAWLALSGCVYEVALSSESRQATDKAMFGLWETVGDDGQIMTLVVLPLNEKEYLVNYPSNSKEGMFFRAFVAQTGEQPIMQFQILGTAAGQIPENRRVYHYGTFRLNAQELVLRLLNPEVVSKDVASPEALAKAIADSRENPAQFNEQVVFHRVKQP